ncbi:DUF6452 family protein [Olleya aquimaris]|uniref:Uncharacterized protein n=1 Tax=Olleya aquimaris TaxID=639310 RepID=A0A327RH40_9FLAO|nr:DUF6452 family protein [Olleya aquimaris]RAJ16336.1 hypothetical protein LY08_01195 [Olleya aquimaris]
MKHLKLISLIVLLSSVLTCERDDLCPETTPTTPSLIIEFFDNATQDSPKNVFNLYVIGEDNDEALPGYSVVTTNELILPLRTDQDSTTFTVISDAVLDDNGNNTTGNEDIVTISYQREDVYVSRACGYKTIFKNVVVSVDGGTDGNWIIFTEAAYDNLTIEDETITHYFFYH